MLNKYTQKIGNDIVLTGSEQNLDVPNIGSHAGRGNNQVIVHIVRTGGSTVTFDAHELYTYPNNAEPQVEEIDWHTAVAFLGDDGSGNLSPIQKTSTEAKFSFAFPSYADRLRIRVKGAGTIDVYVTTGNVE